MKWSPKLHCCVWWSNLMLCQAVHSLVKCSRSFVYSQFVRLSWNASFPICHLLRARNMVRRQSFLPIFANFGAVKVWTTLIRVPYTISLSCASFHWEEIWRMKNFFHPIAHWLSKDLWMVSWIWLFVAQFRVGVVPGRKERIDITKIAFLSGCVFLVAKYCSSELISSITCEYPCSLIHVI